MTVSHSIDVNKGHWYRIPRLIHSTLKPSYVYERSKGTKPFKHYMATTYGYELVKVQVW